MLYGYIFHTFLHICAKTQPPTPPTSYIIAKYVPNKSVPIKFDICAIYVPYMMCISKEFMCINVTHIKHVY